MHYLIYCLCFLSQVELTVSRKVDDTSLTTRLLNPFWTWLAQFIPASIAPNVITLAGFICQLLAFWVSDPSVVQWIGSKTSAISAAVETSQAKCTVKGLGINAVPANLTDGVLVFIRLGAEPDCDSVRIAVTVKSPGGMSTTQVF